MLLMIMGVSGSGKTSLGRALALHLNATFVDGDDLHPRANIEKMRRGEALNDADRGPWLHSICERLRAAAVHRECLVMACSALKRTYRQQFLATVAELRFVYLKAEQNTFARRLAQRTGHFMPSGLLRTQFDALEEPAASEPVYIVDATQDLEAELQAVLVQLSAPLKNAELH